MTRAGLMLVAAMAGGWASTYLYDRDSPLVVRLSAGACIGLTALALVGCVAALAFGVGWAAVTIATVVTGSPAAIFAVREYRAQLQSDLAGTPAALRRAVAQARAGAVARCVLVAIGALVLWQVVDRAMIVRPDGIYTGVRHNFGDLPFHLTAVARFVADNNLPPEHPSFAGVPFTYPFLTDFLSALLVNAGADLRIAMVLPALVAVFALVVLIHQWTLDLTGDRLAAWLAPVLVLVGGGLGWVIFLREAFERGPGVWAFVNWLPHDYTIRDQGWRWGNVITTLLIPQRGITLGLPLAVIVFRQWWLADRDVHAEARSDSAGRADESEPRAGLKAGPYVRVKGPYVPVRRAGPCVPDDWAHRRMWAAGLVAGFLPLIHGHSYLVVMGMAVCLSVLVGSWRGWARFFAAAIAIGAPQFLWLSFGGAVKGTSFVGWALGWDRGEQNAIVFWLANTGLFIPLLLWAVAWRRTRPLVPPRLLRFYVPFLLCFLVPNVVRLAPWIWDNVKVLVYWFLASAPLVSLLLANWYRSGSWRRAMASAVLVSLTLAGALDLWRVLSGAAAVRVFSQPAREFAQLVATTTEPDSTVLHAPIHNHPVFLTGRRSLMGYPGHLWTHGLAYQEREEEIRQMYSGGRNATTLMARYHVDYVVIGPNERRFGIVDDAFFSRYAVAGELHNYRLYRVGAARE